MARRIGDRMKRMTHCPHCCGVRWSVRHWQRHRQDAISAIEHSSHFDDQQRAAMRALIERQFEQGLALFGAGKSP
jgi:hypothetical protein